MPDHPVTEKLRNSVLPYVVTSRRLPKQWYYRTNWLFGTTTDVVIALGAASPVAGFLSGQAGADGKPVSLPVLLDSVPERYYIVVLILSALWVALRVLFAREEGQKKAVLAKSCVQSMRQASAKLHRILDDTDPMPALNKLVQEQIEPVVDRNIQDGSWVWDGPAQDVEDEVETILNGLRKKYEGKWAAVNPNVPRVSPALDPANV